jgi:hypothetical protein
MSFKKDIALDDMIADIEHDEVTDVDKYLRQSLKTAKVEKAKGNKELSKLVLATASKVADYWIKQEQQEYHNDNQSYYDSKFGDVYNGGHNGLDN